MGQPQSNPQQQPPPSQPQEITVPKEDSNEDSKVHPKVRSVKYGPNRTKPKVINKDVVSYGPPQDYVPIEIIRNNDNDGLDSSITEGISNDKIVFLITSRIELLLASERGESSQVSYYEGKFNEVADLWPNVRIVEQVTSESSIEKLEQLKVSYLN